MRAQAVRAEVSAADEIPEIQAVAHPFRLGGFGGFGGIEAALRAPAQDLSGVAARRLAMPGAPGRLVGAVPFELGAESMLLAPVPAPSVPLPVPGPRGAVKGWGEVPSRADYAAAVAAALDQIAAGRVSKVVLARALEIAFEGPIDIDALAAALAADPGALVYRLPLPEGGTLVGASPELLVERQGRQVLSHPLAGSARRRADAAEDHAAAAALLASGKDQHEHALVTEHVRDILAPFCRRLAPAAPPTLSATDTMWHLGSRIEGELRDPDTPVLDLVAALHPTPAICGSPAREAAALIGQLEPVSRGWYAGAVGWTDAEGQGAWHLAIRCAVIEGYRARLHAGAGIVAGSVPEAEADETAAKFGALLAALGLPADALLRGAA